MNDVSKVWLIHAEQEVNGSNRSISAVIEGVEDELKLEERVAYKRRYSKRENVAAEIVEVMRKLDQDEPHCKAIIFLSSCLCEVMKNNKDISQTFQDLILKDAASKEHRLALLWDKTLSPSHPMFVEAFSQRFVDHFKLNNSGVKCRAEPNEMKLPSFVKAIVKQWTGPGENQPEAVPSCIPISEDAVLEVDSVHIVHGGDREAKKAVREVSRELEDGFQLMDPTKYKLYNRIQEHQIPDIVMAEVKSIIEGGTDNHDRTLGVIMWCPRLLDIMVRSHHKDRFNALITDASQKRVVHMCLGVNQFEIGRHFPELSGRMFIPLERLDDSIDTAHLINRVKLALDQPKENLPAMEQAFDSTEANPPSSAQNPGQLSNDERKLSEPSYLSSQDGKAPARMRTNPVTGLSTSIGLVGNPSNQNLQGGRVVPSAFSSHSKDSAGYNSDGRCHPGHGQPIHAQPSSGGSSGNKDWKYVGNNGGSWNGGTMPMGSYHQSRPPFTPSHSDDSLGGHQALGCAPSSIDCPSGVYHQATPSQSSSDTAKYLANGDSMPVTSIHSLPFGSKEPVLPTSDATVECPSGPNSSNSQYHPSAAAPNIFSTSPRNDHHPTAEISPNIRPASNGDGMQRPSGNKIPRRDNTGDISMAGSDAPAAFSLQDHMSRITPSVASVAPSGGSCSDFTSLPPMPSHTNSVSNSSEGPASLPSTTSLNMPASLSRQSDRSFGSGEKPFVQCAEENPHDTQFLNGLNYATNMNSKDAFQQEDYREGSGQSLPNNVIGAEFRSLPPSFAGKRVRDEGARHDPSDEERVHTTPGRVNGGPGNPFFNSQFPEEPQNPCDQPIKDMDYRCREMLKIMLDPETNTGSDWKVFAYYYKMTFEEVKYVDSLRQSSTLYLFNWLHEKRPEVTCGDFKKCAERHQRLDVVRKMSKFHY